MSDRFSSNAGVLCKVCGDRGEWKWQINDFFEAFVLIKHILKLLENIMEFQVVMDVVDFLKEVFEGNFSYITVILFQV
jgi:hypothetical protein